MDEHKKSDCIAALEIRLEQIAAVEVINGLNGLFRTVHKFHEVHVAIANQVVAAQRAFHPIYEAFPIVFAD